MMAESPQIIGHDDEAPNQQHQQYRHQIDSDDSKEASQDVQGMLKDIDAEMDRLDNVDREIEEVLQRSSKNRESMSSREVIGNANQNTQPRAFEDLGREELDVDTSQIKLDHDRSSLSYSVKNRGGPIDMSQTRGSGLRKPNSDMLGDLYGEEYDHSELAAGNRIGFMNVPVDIDFMEGLTSNNPTPMQN